MACVCDAVGTAVLRARFALDNKIRALDELNQRTREWFVGASADNIPRPVHVAVQGDDVFMLWTSNNRDKLELLLHANSTATLRVTFNKSNEYFYHLSNHHLLIETLLGSNIINEIIAVHK